MCFVLFDLFPRKTSQISKGHVSATPCTDLPGREMLEPADMEKLPWEDKGVGAVLGPVALLYIQEYRRRVSACPISPDPECPSRTAIIKTQCECAVFDKSQVNRKPLCDIG